MMSGMGFTLAWLINRSAPMKPLPEGKKLYTDLEEYQPLPIFLPRV